MGVVAARRASAALAGGEGLEAAQGLLDALLGLYPLLFSQTRSECVQRQNLSGLKIKHTRRSR